MAKMTAFWEKMNNENYSTLCLLVKKYSVDKSPFFGNHTYTPEYHKIFKDLRTNIQNIFRFFNFYIWKKMRYYFDQVIFCQICFILFLK